MKIFRNPPTVHKPLANYSHQAELSSSERLLILSGQVGMKPDGAIPEDALEQLKVTLENISRNLEAANMGIHDIVKLTFYVVGEMDAVGRRGVLNEYFKDHHPCMTYLYIAALASPEIKIEIDVIASVETGQD